jgi:hypothetical protein
MSTKSGVAGKTVPQLIRAKRAELRRGERAARTDAYQLALLDSRPGYSRKERRRLSIAA